MDTPVLVFDDDCGFCTWWADYIAAHSDVRLVGFSEVGPELEKRLPDDYEDCSHLVTDGEVYSCGASIEEALTRTDVAESATPAVEALRKLGPYRSLREWAYRHVAHNRSFWGKVMSKTPPARREGDGSERTRSES